MVTFVCKFLERLAAIFLTSQVCTEDKCRMPYNINRSNKIARIILDSIFRNFLRFDFISGKNKESNAKSNFLLIFLSFHCTVTLYKKTLSLKYQHFLTD